MGKCVDYIKLKEKWNSKLNSFDISIDYIDANKLILSDGLVLLDKDRHKLMKRIESKYFSCFISEYYSILTTDVRRRDIENIVKQSIRSYAGKRCIELHGFENMSKVGDIPWNKGTKGLQVGWSVGFTKETHEGLRKISEGRLGKNNPVFTWSEEKKEAVKIKQSETMKQKILDGSFTPYVRNSNTHWTCTVMGNKFRSSWEGVYWYFNQHLLYENRRIAYSKGIYIVDFEDTENKKLIEIKPSCNIRKSDEKINAAIDWCDKNQFTFIIVNEDEIKRLVYKLKDDDKKLFDENSLLNLYKIK